MILPIYKHEEISARATINDINEKYSKKIFGSYIFFRYLCCAKTIERYEMMPPLSGYFCIC